MRKKRRKRYKIISIIKFFALIIGKVGDCFAVGASNEPKCTAAYLHFVKILVQLSVLICGLVVSVSYNWHYVVWSEVWIRLCCCYAIAY